MKYSLLLSLSAGMLLCGAAEKLSLPSGKAELKQKTSSRKAQNFIPEIKKQSIISGGKTLEINPNGQLTLNADGENLAKFFYFFSGKNQHTGQNQWISAGDAMA